MTDTNTTTALTTIIEALKPLGSDDRRRIVDAAMTFLGETTKRTPAEPASGAGEDADHESYPPAVSGWMRQNGISPDEVDRVFQFKDGSFEIHDAPGGSNKKKKSVNTYILTGVGKYLTTDSRTFEDAMARQFCETVGCYDPNNHSHTIKHNGAPEFTGDKKKGYSLTNVGLKRGAALVKELASAAK
jgi:hypothetical protein